MRGYSAKTVLTCSRAALRTNVRLFPRVGSNPKVSIKAPMVCRNHLFEIKPIQLQTQMQQCYFSSRVNGDGSDSDFAPESKVKTDPNDEDGMKKFLKSAVDNHDVLLFMKGSPEAPQCGFSAKVSQILRAENVDFSSADVLANPEVREGIKAFSDWPTIPQLYVQGEFVGGCDIVSDMYETGELSELLEPVKQKQKEAKSES